MSSLVVICGSLSGRTETTRKPVSVRPSVGGSTHSIHRGRGFSCGFIIGPVFSVKKRTVSTDPSALPARCGGGARKSVRFNSLGLGRALQPAKQTRGGLTQTLHLPISFQTASASYEQEIIGAFGNVRKAFGEIRNVEC